jgi:hypothetical protein
MEICKREYIVEMDQKKEKENKGCYEINSYHQSQNDLGEAW